jgi:16S rRNA (cytosine967-C5)-methyltransferase
LRTSSKGAASRTQACLLLRGSPERLPLSSPDMAFATRMYREAVVWQKRIDHALAVYITKPLETLDADVLCSLRIGAVQMLVLGTPSHAAVSATVEAHFRIKTRGFVNAVLRKLACHSEEKLPLHIKYSHPLELVNRWVARYGEEAAERLLHWNNQPPPLGGYCFGSVPANTMPGSFLENYRVIDRQGIFEPPPCFYVQDESSALVGQGMAKLPGETVLEVGAAPGGKTAHLAGTGFIVSIDRKTKRMKKWMENRERLGWKNCFPVAADCSMLPFKEQYDKVIVDAPCTNTGVYRRRFDARWNWTPRLETELIAIQRNMLQESSKAVKPGGVLVYSTCSIEPCENIETALFFEESNPMFERIPFPAPESLLTEDGFLSIFPPDAGLDGLFAVSWVRKPERTRH